VNLLYGRDKIRNILDPKGEPTPRNRKGSPHHHEGKGGGKEKEVPGITFSSPKRMALLKKEKNARSITLLRKKGGGEGLPPFLYLQGSLRCKKKRPKSFF